MSGFVHNDKWNIQGTCDRNIRGITSNKHNQALFSVAEDNNYFYSVDYCYFLVDYNYSYVLDNPEVWSRKYTYETIAILIISGLLI